jgi:poly(3-hydroxybutyrate) depolymerase
MAVAGALSLVVGLLAATATVRADFPCPGCVTIVPAGAAADAPLLVVLHGDDGGAAATVEDWRDAAAAAGAILLAPECPRAAGCAGSWWRWLATRRHDPAWLGRQIDAAAAGLGLHAPRVVVAGFSGGAAYLGWFVPTHADAIAAAAFVSGGNPYVDRCPAHKLPVRIDIGADDRRMLDLFVRPLRRWLEACGGHELVWEEVPHVGHLDMHRELRRGRAAAIVAWLVATAAPARTGTAPP